MLPKDLRDAERLLLVKIPGVLGKPENLLLAKQPIGICNDHTINSKMVADDMDDGSGDSGGCSRSEDNSSS